MLKNQKVIDALNKNKNIGNIRFNLESLIEIFNTNFPNVSLDNLVERLGTLKIEKGSKLLYEDAIQYSPMSNTIIISKLLEKDNVDVKHNMMKVLLSIITAKGNSYGFDNNRKLKALNVGFCEIIANNLVGNTGESNYQDEQILVNSIGESVGVESFMQAFFTNDQNLIMNKLLRCGDVDLLESFLEKMNNNIHTRKQFGTSQLFYLQKNVMEMYGTGFDHLMSQASMQSDSTIKYEGRDILEQYLKSKQPVEAMRR